MVGVKSFNNFSDNVKKSLAEMGLEVDDALALWCEVRRFGVSQVDVGNVIMEAWKNQVDPRSFYF